MSSTAGPVPDLPAEEELVAYLDGELPPEACRRVEARLAADAAYRQRLHDLDQAWEALEALPAMRADEDLARTTLELVTVAAADDLYHVSDRSTAIRRRLMAWVAAGGVAAAVAGFAAARVLLSLNDAAILNDLPVIRYVDLLTQVEDVDFLRRVSSAISLEQFVEDPADARLVPSRLSAAETRDARRQWIEDLSPDEKAILASQTRRFDELPAEEKRRIRALYRDILQAHDAASLLTTLVAYGQWLSQLTPGEQEQLREESWGLPPNDQIDRLRRFARQERNRAARRLSAEDAEKVRAAALTLVEERRSMLLDEMRNRGPADRGRRLEGPRGALMILSRELQDDDAAEQARRRIVAQLSPEARSHLERLGRWNRRLQRYQLWQWIRDALQPKWGAGELEAFFAEELDNSQRERLLNLPQGEMKAELERLYLINEFGFRGGERGIGPDRTDHRPGLGERESGGRDRGRPPQQPPPHRRRPPPPDGPPPR
jgi:hypothetical protein